MSATVPWRDYEAQKNRADAAEAELSELNSMLQDDLGELLEALGMGDHARPKTPREMFYECVAEAARLQRENASLRQQLAGFVIQGLALGKQAGAARRVLDNGLMRDFLRDAAAPPDPEPYVTDNRIGPNFGRPLRRAAVPGADTPPDPPQPPWHDFAGTEGACSSCGLSYHAGWHSKVVAAAPGPPPDDEPRVDMTIGGEAVASVRLPSGEVRDKAFGTPTKRALPDDESQPAHTERPAQ